MTTPPCKDCPMFQPGCKQWCLEWATYEDEKAEEYKEREKRFRYAQDYQVYREKKTRRKLR